MCLTVIVGGHEGARWIAVVASKLVRPLARHGYAHTYTSIYNPHQGVRQQAFLASLGVSHCKRP